MIIKKQEDFDLCIKRLALQVLEDYKNELIIVGIKSRGLPIAKRLKKYLEEECGTEIKLGELNISLYRQGLELLGAEPVIHDVNIPYGISGKEIILVDDLLRTGKTAHSAIDAIMDLGKPNCIKFACLVDIKKRELPIYADYIGWKIGLESDQDINISIMETDGVDEVKLIKKS